MKLLKELGLTILIFIECVVIGIIAMIIAAIFGIVNLFRKNIIQELPPEEDIEFSEKYRGKNLDKR